jgi:hypothetical protein
MAALYSIELLKGFFATTGDVIYSVPAAGDVVVVRCMDFFFGPNTTAALTGFQVEDLTGTVIWGAVPPRAVSNHPYHWEGRQVLHFGDGLHVRLRDDGWSLAISGYLFTS